MFHANYRLSEEEKKSEATATGKRESKRFGIKKDIFWTIFQIIFTLAAADEHDLRFHFATWTLRLLLTLGLTESDSDWPQYWLTRIM